MLLLLLLQTFQPSYASSKVKNENGAIQNRIPTLTSDEFLNQTPSKQTSHK